MRTRRTRRDCHRHRHIGLTITTTDFTTFGFIGHIGGVDYMKCNVGTIFVEKMRSMTSALTSGGPRRYPRA